MFILVYLCYRLLRVFFFFNRLMLSYSQDEDSLNSYVQNKFIIFFCFKRSFLK